MAKRPRSNSVESRMARALDQLAVFDEFQTEIAPALRGAIKAGKKPEEIYELVLSHAAARMATIALTEKDPTKALSALKDVLDRARGKATESKHVKMEIESASDEALDAKLKQLMGEDDDTGDTLQ